MGRHANIEETSAAFAWFGAKVFPVSSPLYARFSLGAAEDADVLALAAHARVGQAVPLLFLGAVQFLLLKGARHPLAAFYPSITPTPNLSEDPYPYFRSFCFDYRDDIEKIISTRLVQTNEVRRCTSLLPAFSLVRHEAGGRPLALVEIGPSAGLNLLWDRYGYAYSKRWAVWRCEFARVACLRVAR